VRAERGTDHRLGTLKGNPFPDSGRAFFDGFGSSLVSLDSALEVAPVRRVSKSDVLAPGRACLAAHLLVHRPPGRLHCAACNKCASGTRGSSRWG